MATGLLLWVGILDVDLALSTPDSTGRTVNASLRVNRPHKKHLFFERRPMTIQELTQAMHEFVSEKGWYQPGSPRPQTPRNIAISLSLEANEVLEHFQWKDQTDDIGELSSELADVTLYLLQLAHITGIDLEKAVLAKLEVNYTRNWDSNEVK